MGQVKGATIDLGHYRGLEHSLEERANKIYSVLSPHQQSAAKRLFVSLVTLGEGREDTRARITVITDLAILAAAEQFAGPNARLVVMNVDAAGGRVAEVSHEALIRHWDRLQTWIEENRTNLRTRADIVTGRLTWLKRGRDASLLIPSGIRLEAARSLIDKPGDVPVGDIRDYVEASIGADRDAAEDEIRRTMAERQTAAQANAALIWARLDFSGPNRPQSAVSIRALWDLARSSIVVREAFVSQVPQDLDQVARLAAGYSGIARAIGLRADFRDLQRMLSSHS